MRYARYKYGTCIEFQEVCSRTCQLSIPGFTNFFLHSSCWDSAATFRNQKERYMSHKHRTFAQESERKTHKDVQRTLGSLVLCHVYLSFWLKTTVDLHSWNSKVSINMSTYLLFLFRNLKGDKNTRRGLQAVCSCGSWRLLQTPTVGPPLEGQFASKNRRRGFII